MSLILSLFMALSAFAGNTAQIQILNENLQPIVGADVLIGNAIDGDTLKTDLNGMVAVPANWRTALPVTVTAAGYLKSLFLEVYPTDISLQIHREDQMGVMEVQGETTNYASLKKDGKVDFALVYPGLRLRQLSQFDVQSVVSPDSDLIQIMTESAAVPSNLSLPSQKENYILPITLEKPIYRMSFKQPGDYRLMAMHGQFPMSQVVGELRKGKAFFEVINYFRILGGGQKDLTLSGSVQNQNIPVNQLVFNETVNVKGVPLAPDQVMFSFSMAKQGDLYFPTDIKRILPNSSADLVLPANAQQKLVVSILMPASEADKIGGSGADKATVGEDELSDLSTAISGLKTLFSGMLYLFNIHLDETIENAGSGGMSSARHNESESTPLFLDLVARPTLNADTITLVPPKMVSGIDPVATFAILSEVVRTPKGEYTVEQRFRVLEVARLGWSDQLQIPAGTYNLTPGKKYRWDILFMGRRMGHNNSGEYFLDGVTHVTRNSVSF